MTDRIREWTRGTRWSVPRVALDAALWIAAAAAALHAKHPLVTVAAVVVIGAGPMHDILFHGHEGAHRQISRVRWINDLFLWLIHALFGISGTAYRAFHLEHHRRTHSDDDPEVRLVRTVSRAPAGWAWLLLPAISLAYVNAWPFRTGARLAVRRRVVRDLAGAALLHVALAAVLGPAAWATFVLAPMATALPLVVALRSLSEHHGLAPGDPWTRTRTVIAHPLLRLLWSNAQLHLEHHLHPEVPFHRLPALRRLLAQERARRDAPTAHGFLRTGLSLLASSAHFGPSFVETHSAAFRMKTRWFRDILRHPVARRHLWSLYYAGEAYEELHPQGVFVDRLEPWLGTLLAKHLADETRHATVFRARLEAEGRVPVGLPGEEDLGWYLLTHVVPDVVERAGAPGPFARHTAMRYMAFLHALELRSLSDLCALIAAAELDGEADLATRLRAILADERFHATYTYRAVFRLATDREEALAVLDEVRRAERKHYGFVLKKILARFESLGVAPASLTGRVRWTLMKAAVAFGLAIPPLPLYERLPSRVTP